MQEIKSYSNNQIFDYLKSHYYQNIGKRFYPYLRECLEEYYDFDIGNFHIHILFGDTHYAVPQKTAINKVLPEFSKYEKVEIAIWDKTKLTEYTHFCNLDIDGYGSHRYEFIYLYDDDRFIDQEWSNLFSLDNDSVAPATICDIIRYCAKISELSAFW